MYNFLSAFMGALIAVMILFNGTLSGSAGNYFSTILIHLVGLFSIILVLIISKSKLQFNKKLPLYLYSGGAIGVFTVLFNNLSFTALGVSLTLALGLLGQTVSSIIIDQFGLLDMKVIPFRKDKIIGLLLVVLGIFVMAVF
ncbi:DMT family transporter [Clostridium sp. JN-9]|uniref:DMT family transporter n=1 Tax=Clostridium sp. JN-9 TaxID=2507159 RepID=UPI000FFE1B1C|nr:DMT family transporter [Clostridium sp. JN-9]QAT41234.1 DMT family transporter [Clostridium sp. JN-9]